MSDRVFGNHPYGDERFRNRKKNRKKGRAKQPRYEEMIRRARQRIIGAMRKRGNGFIVAANVKDAISALKCWVSNNDGKIGKGQQVYGVLGKAFNQLRTAKVITQVKNGFRLNDAVVML